MSVMTDDVHDTFVLQLYRAARKLPPEAFQDFAVQLIKPLLPFDTHYSSAVDATSEPAGIANFLSNEGSFHSRSLGAERPLGAERLPAPSLIPHFAEALRISHALNGTSPSGSGLARDRRALLLADDDGRIRFAQRRFLALAGLEWPSFGGTHLPSELRIARVDASHAVHTGTHARFSIRRCADMLLVEVRALTALDALPAQRSRIAWLYVAGHSHKEIARRMQLAPSTVRNQIRAAYATLGVTSRAQLVAASQPAPLPCARS